MTAPARPGAPEGPGSHARTRSPVPFTFGEVANAVMHFAADSREAALVIEDLRLFGVTTFDFWKGCGIEARESGTVGNP
jgi:hypothetical protein